MKAKRTELENGLRIVTVPLKDNPTVTVLVLVEAGSKYESAEENGISHFLEHLCFKGTASRSGWDITHSLDALGSDNNAFTGHEYTGFYAKSQMKHLPELVDIVSDIYQNAELSSDSIKTERGVIIDEISMYEDMPPRLIYDILMELMYPGQAAGRRILGTKKQIRSLSREEIVSYRDKHYVAPSTTVVVTGGGFTVKEAEKLVKQKFARCGKAPKQRKSRIVELNDGPQMVHHRKDTDQAHIALAVRSVGVKNKKTVVWDVIANLLGGGMSSRLFWKIREEMGVGYYVSASHNTFTDHGFLKLSTGVASERLEEVVEVLVGELTRLKEELVSPSELKKVKEHIIGSMYLGLESSDSLAEYYGLQEVHHMAYKDPARYAKEVRSVTAESIRTVAKKYFTSDRLNLAVISPKVSKKNIMSLLSVL